MRAVTNDDKAKADAIIKLDGNTLQEHNNSTASDGAFCTWVAVETGQKISVECGCAVYSNEVQFDLIVDGILRNTAKTTSREWANSRRYAKFYTGYYIEDLPIEADLVVKDMPEYAYPAAEVKGDDTVGCIEVKIYVLQDEKQERHLQTTTTFEKSSDWKDQYGAPTYTAVQPTQEVELIKYKIQPTPRNLTTTKKRVNGTRPGSSPWAVFRFFYRPQKAINDHGMTKTNKTKSRDIFHFTQPEVRLFEAHFKDEEAPAEAEDARSEIDATTEQIPAQPEEAEVTQLAPAADLGSSDLGSHQISNHNSNTRPAQPQVVITSKSHHQIQAQLSPDIRESTADMSTRRNNPRRSKTPSVNKASINGTHPAADPETTAGTVLADGSDPAHIKAKLEEAENSLEQLGDQDGLSDGSKQTRKVLTDDIKGYHERLHLATVRELQIKEYEATIGSLEGLSEEAKDELLKQQFLSTHDSVASTPGSETPTPEEKPTLRALTDSAVHNALTPAKRTAFTPAATPSKNAFKRKTSITPDTANKKVKVECDSLEKAIAAKRRALEEKRQARMKAQKKADSAEVKRKTVLERMLAELDAQFDEEEEMLQEAEAAYEETESLAAAASREHSMSMD